MNVNTSNRYPDEVVPESPLEQLEQMLQTSRYWDGYQLTLQFGPLENWSGAHAKFLGGRFARHLGSSKLYWRMTAQACREKPGSSRFQAQRVYAAIERRGIFSGWIEAQKLASTRAETATERAEALVCRADCHVFFRDFETAGRLFEEAQALAPENAWVWSETSGLPAEQGDYAAALETVDRALVLDPCYRPAIQRKVRYLQSLQRDEEAIALLQFARKHLQSAGILSQLITLHSEREEWAPMLDLLEEAERLSPLADEGGQSWFYARRTDALLGLNRFDEAAQQARRVPDSPFYERLAEELRQPDRRHKRLKLDVPYIQQDWNTCAPATLSAIP